MRPTTELSDINIFFYYGQSDLDLETEHDIFLGINQPPESMFYNRSESAKVELYENYPNTILLQIGIKYDIMNWIMYRNSNVSDGTEGTLDRRVAASQEYMALEQEESNLNIDIFFIPLANYWEMKSINKSISVGVSS
jgi:hypothetical protein